MKAQSDTLTTTDLARLLLELEKKRGGLTDTDFKNLLLIATLHAGDVAPMNQVLRSGETHDVHRSTWAALADYNDGKYNKKSGPRVNYAKIQRDIFAFFTFHGFERAHGYDKAVEMVMSQFNLGRKAVEKIITKNNKVIKASEPSALFPSPASPTNSKK